MFCPLLLSVMIFLSFFFFDCYWDSDNSVSRSRQEKRKCVCVCGVCGRVGRAVELVDDMFFCCF